MDKGGNSRFSRASSSSIIEIVSVLASSVPVEDDRTSWAEMQIDKSSIIKVKKNFIDVDLNILLLNKGCERFENDFYIQ